MLEDSGNVEGTTFLELAEFAVNNPESERKRRLSWTFLARRISMLSSSSSELVSEDSDGDLMECGGVLWKNCW